MTLAIYTGVAIDSSGNAISGADVEVRLESTGVLASIWSDEAGTVPLSNPALALTDSSGRFSFYVAGADRGYSVMVTKAADTYTLHNQAIGTAGQRDASAFVLNSVTTKGDLIVATASATTTRKGVGSTDGQVLTANSAATEGLDWCDTMGRPNLLINPNWQIDQINEGALYTVNAADVRGPDGWSGTSVGAGVFKLRTIADPENAALKALEITCTTADAALAATDDYFIYSAVEGYDASALMAGTSAAQAITVQFKFKTNVTGVYGVSIANSALNRRYIGTITVSDTSEHEYTVKLTMDTSGTWLYTNGVGLYLRICLAAGSNFQSTAGAWAAGAEQTTSSQANFMSANTNVAYLKRIQLIPGNVAQPHRPADYAAELRKAQRYYEKSWAQGTAVATATDVGRIITTDPLNGSGRIHVAFKVTKRAVPTVTSYSPTTAASGNYRDVSSGADFAATPSDIGTDWWNNALAAHGATDEVVAFHYAATARLS